MLAEPCADVSFPDTSNSAIILLLWEWQEARLTHFKSNIFFDLSKIYLGGHIITYTWFHFTLHGKFANSPSSIWKKFKVKNFSPKQNNNVVQSFLN